ncbi:hypothetical protein IWZ01DRAFT_38163 [Phyllosticta capitalensis]
MAEHATMDPPTQPGNPSDPESYLDVGLDEGLLAGYCGFEDVCELRRYLCSHTFLCFWLQSSKAWARDIPWEAVLDTFIELQCSGGRHLNLITRRRTRYSVSVNLYPVFEDRLREQLEKMACLVAGMANSITKAFVLSAGMASIDPAAQLKAKRMFHSRTRRTFCLPKIGLSSAVQLPQLILVGDQAEFARESQLEPFNRALQLLRFFTAATEDLRFGEYFFRTSQLDASVAVGIDCIPPWMAYKHLVVEIGFLRSGADQAQKEAYYSDVDPRLATQKTFREHIREVFYLLGTNAYVSEIVFFLPGGNDANSQVALRVGDLNWHVIQDRLKDLPAGCTVECGFSLRVLG